MTVPTVENLLAPYAQRMQCTPQPQKWHGEGDVYTHTRMVCDALVSLPEYQAITQRQQDILLTAAALHDIGKTATTAEVMGEITAPSHAPAGSRMAREMLWWQYGLCGNPDAMLFREAVTLLIRYHSFPPHAIDAEDAALRLHRIAANSALAPDFSIRMLCILAKADMTGRICTDKADMLERVDLCLALAEDEGCADSIYPFPDINTRHAFLRGRDVWKDQLLHDDTWGTVHLVCGLPGTGKDFWISRNLPDIPMVSPDNIRAEKKISPTANQGIVANIAKDMAKEYLRRHTPFVWNATNLTATMRGQLVALFESYKAKVKIVYLETDWETQLSRNASRRAMVPVPVITSMLGKLSLPEMHEAADVAWLTV